MKKFLFLIALFTLMGGVNSYATKKYASFANGTQTWTSGTNTFSWNSTSNNFIATGLPTGDISSYTNFHCTVSDFSENANFIRLVIKNGKDPQITESIGAGEFNVDVVTKYPTFDFTCVTDILIFGSNSATAEHVIDGENPASVVITDCYMEKPMSLTWGDDGTADIDLTDLTASGGFSFNDQTGELTRTEGSGELSINFPAGGVDLSSITGFSVTYTGTNLFGGFKIGTSESKKKDFYSNPTGRDDLASHITVENVGDPSAITLWKWWENSSTGTMTISSIKLKGGVIKANPGGEIAVESLERKYYEGGEWRTGTVSYSYGSGISNVVGDGNATQDEYIDLSGYNELRMYVSSGDIRVFAVKEDAFTPSADGYIITKDGVKQNGQWNGIQDTEHKLVKNGDYYYITIDDLKAACGGQAKLIGVKAEYGNTVNVSKVIVIEDSEFNYSISGNGVMTASATAALADATATSYDATGVTGTGVDFTSVANPNALFKANAGVLANTKNVIVDGTCANLELTDGYPFKAPIDFTATEATYSTTINAEAGAGTLCLPFAAAIPGGVTAYTLTYTSGDKAAATPVETTIPANTPVLLNGSGAAEFTGSGAVDADATNENGALTGVFKATTVPENKYVLQNGDNGLGFYKVVTDDIVANPFRAYLTALLGARTIGITYGGVTNINEVKANKVGEKDVYYNLKGQRVSNPTKGIFIKNGVKVSF